MTVAASVTVAQLIMLKGPTLKNEVSEGTARIKKEKKKKGRQNRLEEPMKERSYDRRNFDLFFLL